jgi:dTDP-6-deoxy-L-talose 4-dehydrogenase (NAD+)
MKVLVTGATGFVGRVFVRQALACGHTVCALIRPGSAGLPAHRALTSLVGTLDSSPWADLARFAPDVCVHAAWMTDAGIYRDSPQNDRYVEESLALVGTLFEQGVGHVVTLGTCAEYQASADTLGEDRSPLGPRSSYARAKHRLRVALAEHARGAGACLAWARIFQPYGAGEPAARLCSTVARRLTRGERVILDTPQAVRDWIHVEDVAAALLCMVDRRVDAVVNVGCGVGRTVESVALVIADLVGRRHLVAANDASDVVGPLVADATRLRGLGWAPRVELETGLAALIEELR